MSGTSSNDNQLYFNAPLLPAHMILMASILIYRPQLVRLANIWEDPDFKHRFGLAYISCHRPHYRGYCSFVDLIGIPLNTFLYGTDFEQYRNLACVMVVTGAGIDYLYQIITISAQRDVTRIYVISVYYRTPVIYDGWIRLTS